MNINPLDQSGKLFYFEAMNPNPTFRKGQSGQVYRVSFELHKEDWEMFVAAKPNIRLFVKAAVISDMEEGSEKVTDEQIAHDAVNGKPKKERKPKEAKGPYGQLWKYLYLDGFYACPGVLEAVEGLRLSNSEDAWSVLHRVFDGVESLALISREDIYAKFPPDKYPQVKTMVEQALRKANKQ